MSNALYEKGRESFLKGDIDWLSDAIKAVLVDSNDYTVNLSTHEFLDDIPAAARVATSTVLANKSATGGIADADDVTFSSVSGDSVEAIVLFKDTGTESTSSLIAYINLASGFPITPDGGDIVVQWDNGLDKIFKL